MNKSDEWFGKKEFGKTICFDLDGVILEFDGWKGEDKFGKPINGAVETINKLKYEGWYVIIFTTRIVTMKLLKYLLSMGLLFDDINASLVCDCDICDLSINRFKYQSYKDEVLSYSSGHLLTNYYWKHNPYKSSIKPIATVYVDDMDWRQNGENFNKKTWKKLYRTIQRNYDTNGNRKVRFWRRVSKIFN